MLRVIGLMSGTSLDGVDAAWLETDGERIGRFGPRLTIAYDEALRRDLRHILTIAAAIGDDDPRLQRAVSQLTEAHIRAVQALEQPADLIGFHGQTILHQPQFRRTWQVGDAALLAERTQTPVAYDFRSADVAAGGEGAPLAPVFHAALAADLPKPLAILNIGGVANVTWIGPDGAPLAYDTGPGNAAIDDWALRHTGQALDRDGALARAGTIDPAILTRLLNHPYFHRPPPKSLDRLDFQAALSASGLDRLSPEDGAATLTAFTAQAVALGPLPTPPKLWLVCGGGRHNPALMAALKTALNAPVEPVEIQNWDGDALEAQCFGFLAARTFRNLPISYPTTTGAPTPLTGGRIVRPGPPQGGRCPP
jgi:anhydro-N-acetylmuramic acid kinase